MTSFDERAATWDDPMKTERAARVARVIGEAVPLSPSVRLLEYGAGTGLVTQALGDRIGPVALADTSSGMRGVMAEKVATGTLPADARIWAVDLSTDPPPDDRFDLVVTVLTLHHIPDLAPVLAAFAALLDDGGHLCVADLESEDGSFHGEGFHGHHGFDRAELAAQIEAAGFGPVEFRDCGSVERPDGTYPMFLATAVRA
ncbi:MAG: class I SAM-dependent methyltransferase [Actinobacteria bacterium]|nr:class I SAM-dependent methyltransferase [Actinomycetota bacterium]